VSVGPERPLYSASLFASNPGFGSALNLNVHFHMLIPDGVYLSEMDPPSFRRLGLPTNTELQALVQRIGDGSASR
jgi:hypothetical protein